MFQEAYCDVTLACEGQFFPVHKLVLSVCSEYFEDILRRTTCAKPVIVLKDIRHTDLQALLNYMYAGEANVPQSDLSRLIKAAECLRIKGLAVPDESPPAREKKRPATEINKSDLHSTNKKRKSDLVNSINCHGVSLESDDNENSGGDIRRLSAGATTTTSTSVHHTVHTIDDSTPASPSQPVLIQHQLQLQHIEHQLSNNPLQQQQQHQSNNNNHSHQQQQQQLQQQQTTTLVHQHQLQQVANSEDEAASSMQEDVTVANAIPEVGGTRRFLT